MPFVKPPRWSRWCVVSPTNRWRTSKARSIRAVILKRFRLSWRSRIFPQLSAVGKACKKLLREEPRPSTQNLQPFVEEFQPARGVALNEDERSIARNYFLLTMKPTIYAANVNEATLNAPDEDEHVRTMREIAASEGAECVVICAQLEADLVDLSPAERTEYLESLSVKSSGVDQLIKSAYRVLGLMSFLTAGEKEARAWTIPQGSRAQYAAGTIHSDIARGFIRAEIFSYDDLIRAGTYAAAREQGLLRLEGKDYIMQEGDVVNFRFNV